MLPEQIENVYAGKENAVRRQWVGRMMNKGLRRKLAYDAQETRVGWLEYMPVEEALDRVDGENVNIIHCLIDGIDYRGGSDVARALLQSVEQESAASGRGVAVELHKFKDIFLERGYEVIAKHPYGPLGELFLKTSGPNQ